MLKFQNNNTIVIETFEDFILTAYIVIDELYHQFAPPEITNRRHILDAKLSDPKITSPSTDDREGLWDIIENLVRLCDSL